METYNIKDMELSFKEKFELRNSSREKLSEWILKAGDIAMLDIANLKTQIKMARKASIGEVPALILILAKIYEYPLNRHEKDYTLIEPRQEEIEIETGIKEVKLLEDVRVLAGNHSFLDKKTMEIIEAREPVIEELGEAIDYFCELNEIYYEYKLTEELWQKEEDKALKKIRKEKEEVEASIKDLEKVNDKLFT